MNGMELDEGVKIEEFGRVLSQLTGRPVTYYAGAGVYMSDNSIVNVTRDVQNNRGQVILDGVTYPFGYDPVAGKYFPLK